MLEVEEFSIIYGPSVKVRLEEELLATIDDWDVTSINLEKLFADDFELIYAKL